MAEEPEFTRPLHVGAPNVGDREAFLGLVESALDRNWLTNDGPLVREFEARIAAEAGVPHCVAVANGTIGLEIAIRALGLSGEVIVPSFTFVATAHALEWSGVEPVFADIDERTHALDPASVRRRITPRTTGIIGVHLWGRPAPVLELEAIARETGIALLFDAAHAFGTSIGDRPIGSFGRAEVFSFHATKFFNAIEGGAIVTEDADLAARARLMRNFGFAGEDVVVSSGTNGKMNEISAAMGLANLGTLQGVVDRNRENLRRYLAGLEGVPGVHVLPVGDDGRRNFQYVVLIVEDTCRVSRDGILERLRRNNVLARRYFWPGCHRMEPYRSRDPHAGRRLPVTERVADSVIVLPTGASVDDDAIDRICAIVRSTVDAA